MLANFVRFRAALLVLLVGGSVQVAARAEMPAASKATTNSVDCKPPYLAPTDLFQNPKSKNTDQGVIALRFLDLSVFKKPVKVLSGVDLSTANIDETWVKVDMVQLKRCGADFAFVRLSGRDDYVTPPSVHKHPERTANMPVWQIWNDALAAGIEVYPYHFLYPSDRVLTGKIGTGFPYSEDGKQVLTAEMESEGHEQARKFIGAYANSHLNPQQPSKLGFPRYIALDIEVALPPKFGADKHHGQANRYAYSVGYASMACAWVKDVRAKYPLATVIIYTNLRMDNEYTVMNIDYTDSRCLSQFDVWLALPTVHGGHFAEDTESASLRTTAREFCFAANAARDRCTFHQYTQRASIAFVDTRRDRTNPLHMDLNRFHTGRVPWELMPPDQSIAKKGHAAVTAHAQSN